MKELVEYIAKSIVTMPDAVVVTVENDSDVTILKLEVAPEDRGRVIGKQGRVAQAMRTLLRITAIREGVKVQLQIM
ncbi:MAG: KH domain-containing protein [Chloroflexi bacterium]|nr:KH domain-containing protein [Chloroflexota bacterium]